MLELGKQYLKHLLLKRLLRNNFYFLSSGYCPCCESEALFKSYNNWLRDFFLCNNCGSIPRERALMLTIEQFFPDWKALRIHETSPSKRAASLRLSGQCINYLETQFFPSERFGSYVGNVRNENLENQTFESEIFDLVISQDVMEHVYHPEKAFAEIARTLKPGGAHIFTVPMVNKHRKTEVWAIPGENGEPIFLKTPEYHGNPIDLKGSAVTMHWGYDIVEFIKDCSGMDTTIEHIDNLNYGIRSEYIEVLISRKPW